MATRENQFLQIALILCVLVIVALGASTYLYFNKSETKRKESESLNAEVNRLNNAVRVSQDKIQFLEHLVGYHPLDESALESLLGSLASDDDVKVMYENFQRDVANYGAGMPEKDQKELNYTSMPEKLVATIRELSNQLDERDQGEVRLTTKVTDAEKERDTQIDTIRQDKVKLETLNATERQEFNRKYDVVQKDRDGIKNQLAGMNDKIKEVEDKSTRDVESLSTQLAKLEQLYIAAREKLAGIREDSFEVADGKVTWVNQKSKVVWINLGSADGLRRQVTFSVFDPDESAVSKAEAKGRIEVTRIMEAHMAEARILEDSSTNPILPSDTIFSPAWRPGRRVRFALAGFMDVDEDGQDDRQYLRNLILSNGGVIDAELLDTGEVKGSLSVNTRYLVKGDRPTEKTGPNMQKGYSQMIDDASTYGVEQISIDKLLSYMGAKGSEKTITLGTGNADDYRARAKKDREKGSQQFRQRRPPARGQNGAF